MDARSLTSICSEDTSSVTLRVSLSETEMEVSSCRPAHAAASSAHSDRASAKDSRKLRESPWVASGGTSMCAEATLGDTPTSGDASGSIGASNGGLGMGNGGACNSDGDIAGGSCNGGGEMGSIDGGGGT